jgi:hypothetical protein
MTTTIIKSDLQNRLEAAGWEFLTNECIDEDLVFDERSGFCHVKKRILPKTDAQIRELFCYAPFTSIKITDAYDVRGNPVEGLRAVYVMRSN